MISLAERGRGSGGTWVLAVLACFMAGCVQVERSAARPQERDNSYAPAKPGALVIAKDTRFRARLGEMLDSDTTHAGHRFQASLMDDVRADNGRVALPRGATLQGYVADVKHIVNRTTMRLHLDYADLPDGRRIPIDAEPAQESKIDMDQLGEKGAEQAKGFIVRRGIDAVTGGVLFPVWLYLHAEKAYGFITKESRMILPKGCIVTVELERPAYIPPASP